jgi:hypothetical protein
VTSPLQDLFIKEVNDILVVFYSFSVQHSKETQQSGYVELT